MTKRSDVIFAKLDSGFFSNSKIVRAGRDGRDVYLHVLCMNAQRGAKGFVPIADIAPWYLRRQLEITDLEARNGVARAIEAELIRIEGDQVVIDGWDGDWSRRAATGAERTEKWRESQSRDGVNVTRDGAVTCDGSEERRGEERESKRHSLSDSSAAGSDTGSRGHQSDAARGARQRPLPPGWQPTSAAVEYAHSRDLDIAHEAEGFRLSATADGKTFADPDAAFQKWMRGSRDVGRASKAKKKAGSTTRTPKPMRFQTADGTWIDEHDARRSTHGSGATAVQSKEKTT